MTTNQTLKAIRAMGLTATITEYREFRIALPGKPAGAYYTNDKEDALDTAKLMAEINSFLSPKAPKPVTLIDEYGDTGVIQ